MSGERSVTYRGVTTRTGLPPSAHRPGATASSERVRHGAWRHALTWSVGAIPPAALAGMAVATGSCALAGGAALLALGWFVDATHDAALVTTPVAARRLQTVAAAVAAAAAGMLVVWAAWCLRQPTQHLTGLLPIAGVLLLVAGAATALWREVGRCSDASLSDPGPWPMAALTTALAAVPLLAFHRARFVPVAPLLLTAVLALLLLRLAWSWRPRSYTQVTSISC
jgi:hypothetical protein